MNNYGLATADRLTHVKVVAVALIAAPPSSAQARQLAKSYLTQTHE